MGCVFACLGSYFSHPRDKFVRFSLLIFPLKYVIVMHSEFHLSGNFSCIFFSTLGQWFNPFISCSSMSELLMQSWTSCLRTTKRGASFWDVNTVYGELCPTFVSVLVMHDCALIC